MPKRKRGPKRFIGERDSDDESKFCNLDTPDERSSTFYHDEIHEYNLERENKLLLQDEENDFVKHYDKEEVLAIEDSSDEDYHFDPGDEGDSEIDINGEAVDDSKVDDDENENENLVNMDSDIDDKDEDDLPDARAWGKKKSVYYNTDYVDKGYRDYRESDAEAAEAEEREVIALEKRLTEEMDEADFGFDLLQGSKPESHEVEEKIKVDLQSLSKQEKLEFLERNSPEFMELRSDFVAKLTELQEKLQPLVDLIKENKIPPGQWREYILTKYQLILLYCTNISFYFVLKAKGVQASDHPVMERISSHKKLLKVLDSFEHQPSFFAKESEMKEIKTKHKPLPVLEEERTQDFNTSEDQEEDTTGVEESKRGITYEIAKNKGLTPYRKKELRNPRVKHRRKFERAKVRRKGQFREPVKEITKYGGEFSGIRTGVTKSTKLK